MLIFFDMIFDLLFNLTDVLSQAIRSNQLPSFSEKLDKSVVVISKSNVSNIEFMLFTFSIRENRFKDVEMVMQLFLEIFFIASKTGVILYRLIKVDKLRVICWGKRDKIILHLFNLMKLSLDEDFLVVENTDYEHDEGSNDTENSCLLNLIIGHFARDLHIKLYSFGFARLRG